MPRRDRITVKEVSLLQIETVAHALAQEMMDWDEPIPAFNTRFPNKLESCLRTPFQKFGGKSMYRGLVGKGAALFYLMVKNHPFQNGNKRIAVMTLLYFLVRNGYWITVSNEELYLFATEVASSNANDWEKVRAKIRRFLNKYIVRTNLR